MRRETRLGDDEKIYRIHKINNVMTVAQGKVQLLSLAIPSDSALRPRVEKILSSLERVRLLLLETVGPKMTARECKQDDGRGVDAIRQDKREHRRKPAAGSNSRHRCHFFIQRIRTQYQV